MSKENKKFEKYNNLLDRMTLANVQVYGSSKSQKGIDKKVKRESKTQL